MIYPSLQHIVINAGTPSVLFCPPTLLHSTLVLFILSLYSARTSTYAGSGGCRLGSFDSWGMGEDIIKRMLFFFLCYLPIHKDPHCYPCYQQRCICFSGSMNLFRYFIGARIAFTIDRYYHHFSKKTRSLPSPMRPRRAATNSSVMAGGPHI